MSLILDQEIELICPNCKYVQVINLEDAMNEKLMICGGCKKTIKLKTKGDDLGQAEENLQNLLKGISKKIKIKL